MNDKQNSNAKKPKKEEIKGNEKKKRVWSRLKTYQKVLIILFSTIFFLCACGAGIFYHYINSANRAIKSGTSTEVANASGLELSAEQMIQKTKQVIRKTSKNYSSMLQSVQQGKKTEIQSINGIIVDAGQTFGVNVPLNSILIRLF